MKMSNPIRTAFALILLLLAGLVVFQRFHGFFLERMAEMSETVKVLNGQISTTANNNNYIVSIQKKMKMPEQPFLPDISEYTVEGVAAKAPPFKQGSVIIGEMKSMPDFRKFISPDGGIQFHRLAQTDVRPKAIIIQKGDYDFAHFYQDVAALPGGAEVLVKDGNVYTLRLPLLVGKDASLNIGGDEVGELRLSLERGTFLANSGTFFAIKTKITGWSEKAGKPAPFVEKRQFRPFIVTWSGSRMYMAGSTIASLGYLKGKSYGMAFSTCRFCLEADPKLPRPTGTLVGNTFTDLYYGFYSFEADDVAIVGNKYVDNVIYGIDPHDRSRRLIIAKNESYGARERHGIIVSREVNDCWIFDNYTHDNAESGIVIDRTSINNFIVGNVAARNTRDGITFFESPNAVSWGNKVYGNKSAGIRVRNSWNVSLSNDEVTDNGSLPIIVYSSALEAKEADRNFKLDPYTRRAGANIYGATIKARDRKPAIKIDGVEELAMGNITILSSGPVIGDNLFPNETDIVNNIGKQDASVLVSRKTFMLKMLQRLKKAF
jgi:poly(beta-D-mannuronate) C5 epimerase